MITLDVSSDEDLPAPTDVDGAGADPRPIVIGRTAQLDAARRAVAAAARGEPSLLLLTGEAGIGKTRLATEVQEHARSEGFVVLRGECVDTVGGELPYAPLVSALREAPEDSLEVGLAALGVTARRDVAAVLQWLQVDAQPVVEADEAGQGRLFGALTELVRGQAAARPVLLVLEDLHWADRSTLDFVGYLARCMRRERLVVVGTVRAEALVPALSDAAAPGRQLRRLVAELGRLSHVQRIELEPLGVDEIRELVTRILARVPPRALVERISRRSSGNPYYIEELVAVASGKGDHTIPRDVREAVMVRVEGLSSAARSVLRAAAAIARPATEALLGAVTRLDEGELCGGLREALAAHLLQRESGEAFAYRHALAREAVYAELLPHECRALHLLAGTALAAEPAATSAAELARHWHAAGAHDRALRASFDAGVQADAVFASGEALAHYEQVLKLWDCAPEATGELAVDRAGVTARAAEAAFLAAEHQRCVELWREALGHVDAAADPQRAARLHQRLGRCQPWNTEASLGHYQDALALLPEQPSAQRASLLADIGFGLSFLERWEEARTHAEEALVIACATGAVGEEAQARSTLGVSLAFLGHCAEGEQQLRAALALARKLELPKELARVLLDLAEILRLTGRFADALEVMREGEDVAARLGMEESLGAFMTANAAEDQLRLGRWDGVACSLASLAGRDLGPPTRLAYESVSGRLRTAQGDFPAAAHHLARALEVGKEVHAIEFAPAIRAGLAELSLWQRDAERALAHVGAGVEAIGDALDPLHAPVLFSIGVRAEADLAAKAGPRGRAVAEQRVRDATSLLEQLDVIVERHRGVGGAPEALAHRALAVAELTRARDASDPGAWRDAADCWDALSAPYPAAYARWRAAEALVPGRRARPDATRELRAAAAAAQSLGAAPLLDEIERLAGRARLALTEPCPRSSPGATLPAKAVEYGLTARELDVLRLLAQGLTDKEIGKDLFISPRTAQVHVCSIRMKLGVGTRTAAAHAAERLGLIKY